MVNQKKICRNGKGKFGQKEGVLIKCSYPTKKKLEQVSFSFQAFNRMQYMRDVLTIMTKNCIKKATPPYI